VGQFEFSGARVYEPQQLRKQKAVEISCGLLRPPNALRLTEPRSIKPTHYLNFFNGVRSDAHVPMHT
jgi:hypothetical protein